MRIYNYLFYKSFILAKKSNNFEDAPVVGGIMFVIGCLMMNIFTIFIFIEGLGINTGIHFSKEYKYPFVFGLLGFLLFYYYYKGRYKKIIKYYESRKNRMIQIPALMVIIFYLVICFGLLLLAGLFKNRDWIFSDIG